MLPSTANFAACGGLSVPIPTLLSGFSNISWSACISKSSGLSELALLNVSAPVSNLISTSSSICT